MEIGYTEEHQALRNTLRAYYAALLTPEVEAQLADSHGIGPHMRRVVKQMAADGWLGIGWPKEYGGQGLGPIEQYIFFDESMRAGAPVPMLTINTVGPTIMDFGTQEQKEFFLPKILAGDIHFCIGYTEPESGTDLASLQTRAVRDGDEYVINGQKIYTSLAGDADYIWLATRTDPEAAKHKGISMFIVPMDTPGHQGGAHAPARRPQHQLHLLRGRPGAGGQPGGRREPGVDPHHQPAQPRAGDAVLAGHHRAGPRRRAGLGPDHQAGRRPAGHRPGVGAGPPGPGLRPARVPQAHQLEGGVDRHPGPPRRGRRLHHQGVRHRVLHGGVPAADWRWSARPATSPGTRPTPCWPVGWRCTPAAWSS